MENRDSMHISPDRRVLRVRLGMLASMATALLLTVLATLLAGGSVLAQTPPPDGVSLVNRDEGFVERKGDGLFIARPVFNRQLDTLYYGVRDPDTGDWLAPVYRVQGGERKLRDGWQYTWEYPFSGQELLDPERPFLLVVLAPDPNGNGVHTFHAVIPVHQPGNLWDRVLAALEPSRWARALAGWVVEGVHGTLCGVVEKASGRNADNC